ncbi:MAG: PadR family transcriptional regulator [Lentisphaerae bacterium]|jgi:PadR family transcriptional regulator, regulatory protein PadR|nr:PadR family transcriptional regulator [Lentisphaerota bacterium]MBT4818305.1 PadR family transcriptional regulator [Lentisphaerota bacterium]MBT5610434.1 PadR family transcriptional regulator [Lentisphaerota bacterium]MBT7061025.1 PadR family transcriptional regulator [Lentisphaerota bacterium]MBT7842190.1 PadR family transcriptional regulator [Lentisphaerota bacterium]
MRSWVSQLRKGVTELVVLTALQHEEAYGYELLQRINRHDGLSLTESTVYPLLARLKRDGLVGVRAAPSPSGPPRRYYALTQAGIRRLEAMMQEWDAVAEAVRQLQKEETP